MNPIETIIVDDHPMVRDGINSMLRNEKNIKIIGEAAGWGELELLLKQCTPQILLLDINLPTISGIDICQMVTERYSGIKCIMLSMHIKEDFIFSALKAGAKGYIPKTAQKQELINAIHTVSEGKEYFSAEISDIILKSYIRQARDKEDEQNDQSLTKREKEILRHVALGKLNQEIADELFISIRTVESHKTHILNKLNLKNNVDLVRFAIKNGIIEL